MSAFEQVFTAAADDIDELGHVNNAVWVRWIQDVATAHWRAAADPGFVDAYIWVVTRHEIDYLRPLHEGESVTARTWVDEPPRGARFDRLMSFTGADGKDHVRARTTWAMIDKATGRPARVPREVVEAFLSA